MSDEMGIENIGFIQIGDGKKAPITWTTTTTGWISCDCDADGFSFGDIEKSKNKHVPERGYINEEKGEATFIWLENGKEITIKVFCDSDDAFNADAAFAHALKYKIFGSKTQYKKKWWNIIAKRITWLGNVDTAKNNELLREDILRQERKRKEQNEKAKKKQAQVKELENLLGIVPEKTTGVIKGPTGVSVKNAKNK